VKCDKIIFREDPTWDFTQVAMMKATAYQQSGLRLFAESDKKQAELIARVSNKPVLCPVAERVYT
jgi:hypothetical protein